MALNLGRGARCPLETTDSTKRSHDDENGSGDKEVYRDLSGPIRNLNGTGSPSPQGAMLGGGPESGLNRNAPVNGPPAPAPQGPYPDVRLLGAAADLHLRGIAGCVLRQRPEPPELRR